MPDDARSHNPHLFGPPPGPEPEGQQLSRHWRALALFATCLIAVVGGPNLQSADAGAASSTAGDTAVVSHHQVPSEPVATVGELTLYSPVVDTPTVGFHQASFPDALELTPADPDVVSTRESLVLPSRDRPTSRTSAIDISAPEGHHIVSPVTGTVISVEDYALYGEHPDVRIELAPTGHPDRQITLLHVTDPYVQPGDVVLGGRSPLARAGTGLPFVSQIDRFTPEVAPHIHIEVKDLG